MELMSVAREKLIVEHGQYFKANGKEYQVRGKIGDGAIGVVRKAVNTKNGSTVAVKFLAPDMNYIEEDAIEDIVARFAREGKRGFSLLNNNLTEIMHYEENINGKCFVGDIKPPNPFILMEYVAGRTLEDFLRKKSGEGIHFNITPQTLAIARGIASSLQYLHHQGIVHRDVKPANIYLSKTIGDEIPEIIKLGDFGIVKWGDFKSSMTSGNLTMVGQKGLGTLKYMSPEQSLDPSNVGVRSDMYSFGITIFELFTNQIFPTPIHVHNLVLQRYSRKGDTVTHLHNLGLGIVPSKYEILFSKAYDMLLSAPNSRPSSRDTLGLFDFLISNMLETHE